jgi:hypothetical protein
MQTSYEVDKTVVLKSINFPLWLKSTPVDTPLPSSQSSKYCRIDTKSVVYLHLFTLVSRKTGFFSPILKEFFLFTAKFDKKSYLVHIGQEQSH